MKIYSNVWLPPVQIVPERFNSITTISPFSIVPWELCSTTLG